MLSSRANDSPALLQATKPGPSRLIRLVIDRGNGNLVPLIPVDEFPNGVRFEGVPGIMKIEDTCGMQNVGKLPFTGQHFDLAQPTTNVAAVRSSVNGLGLQHFLASDAHVRQSIEKTSPAAPVQMSRPAAARQLPASTAATTWRKQEDPASAKAQAKIDAIIASTSRSPSRALQTASQSAGTSSRSSPEPAGDKIYCTHWIRHGECDYTQQGCRYKHEMPDRATLSTIGFRTVPRWWQERTAVQLSSIPKALQRRSSTASDSSSESESDDGEDAQNVVSDQEETEDTEKSKDVSEFSPSPSNISADSSLKLLKTGDLIDLGSINPESVVSSAANQSAFILNSAISPASPPRNSAAPKKQKVEQTPNPSRALPVLAVGPNGTTQGLCRHKPSAPEDTIQAVRVHGSSGSNETIQDSRLIRPLGTTGTTSGFSSRKVFVPAGESKDLHIAAARKHAQEKKQELEPSAPTLNQDAINSNKLAFKRNATLKHSQPTESLNKRIPKRPHNDAGLMASMHATPPTTSSTPASSAIRSTILSQPSSPKSTRRQARSRPTGSSSRISSDDDKIQPTTSKSEEHKNQNKASSACRPRVPARSGPKLERLIKAGAMSREIKAVDARH